jgi:hypothetical protein
MSPKFIFSLVVSVFFTASLVRGADNLSKNDAVNDTIGIAKADKLVVMWTTGDKEVAMRTVFLYTYNAKKRAWWGDVTLLVWGPSAKLLAEDQDVQDYLKKIQNLGVKVLACKGCTDNYDISEKLIELGVEVRYTGVDLTNFIKERYLITF